MSHRDSQLQRLMLNPPTEQNPDHVPGMRSQSEQWQEKLGQRGRGHFLLGSSGELRGLDWLRAAMYSSWSIE